eukprot:3729004-Rhodomonas_salina.1
MRHTPFVPLRTGVGNGVRNTERIPFASRDDSVYETEDYEKISEEAFGKEDPCFVKGQQPLTRVYGEIMGPFLYTR